MRHASLFGSFQHGPSFYWISRPRFFTDNMTTVWYRSQRRRCMGVWWRCNRYHCGTGFTDHFIEVCESLPNAASLSPSGGTFSGATNKANDLKTGHTQSGNMNTATKSRSNDDYRWR